jgi:hypothetical protein
MSNQLLQSCPVLRSDPWDAVSLVRSDLFPDYNRFWIRFLSFDKKNLQKISKFMHESNPILR